MNFDNKYAIEKDGNGLVLDVYGDTNYILKRGFHRCGNATYGVHIEYGKNKAGGVLPLDEVVRLRDFLNDHLKEVLNH